LNTVPRIVTSPLAADHRGRIAEILRSTGNFREEEVDVALELFDASFERDDYTFVGAFEVTSSRLSTVDSADGRWPMADGCIRR